MFDAITVGDRVEIKSPKNPSVVFLSKIVDILDVKTRAISMYRPILSGVAMSLRTDETYELTVFTNQNIIRFECVFEGYLKEELNYFVVMKIANTGFKIQRREFFRFTCMLAMKFSIIEDVNSAAAKLLQQSGYAEKYDGIVRDIGGGGIRFITSKDLDLDHHLQCTIMLGSSTMMVKGRLLEKQYMPKSSLKFQYRVLFLDLAPTTQEEIVNYIFAEQRRQRKMNYIPN